MITIPTHILKRKDIYAPGKMILAVIEANPDISFRVIAQILYISPITVRETVRSLHDKGFLTMTGRGKTFTYRINDRPTV